MVNEYRYLGLLFSHNLNFRAHDSLQESRAKSIAGALQRLDLALGHKSVDILRERITHKWLLCGCNVLLEKYVKHLQINETTIWKKWLGLPIGSVNSALRLEVGLTNILFKYKHRLLNNCVGYLKSEEGSLRHFTKLHLQEKYIRQ